MIPRMLNLVDSEKSYSQKAAGAESCWGRTEPVRGGTFETPTNLKDRMKHLFNSGDHSNVHFLVGEEKELFRAHKLILKATSEVFDSMFRFDSKNGKTENSSAVSSVEVPDIEPSAFRVLLSFIYTDDLSGLNGDNAMTVLYAAKKYGVDALVTKCLQIPISELPNVFLAYAQARLLESEDFADQCMRYICQFAEFLFKSNEFLQIDQNILNEIFGNNYLLVNDEYETWKAALRWSDEKCRQNGKECSAENRRSALGPALTKIHFPRMLPHVFVKNIVPYGILTIEEIVGVYQFHCHPNFRGTPGLYPLKFPSHGRISDWNQSHGNRGTTLAMEIEEFSKFAQKEVRTERYSEEKVPIKGFKWEINAEIMTEKKSNKKCLGFFLWCTASEKKEKKNWSCKCSATFRIVSQKCGVKDLTGRFDDIIFNSKEKYRGFFNFITFSELMDTSKGLYNKNEDKVTLAIDVIVEGKKTDDADPTKSNGSILWTIEKLSEFAREILLSERSSETVHLKEFEWKICAEVVKNENNEKCLDFSLACIPHKKDTNWSCECTATLRIVSKKSGTENFSTKIGDKSISTKKDCVVFFPNSITFTELMDADKGLYDEKEDTVILAIDFNVKVQKGTKGNKLTVE
ncbi:hypothetical protein niasHS_015909 [Heterodera schachtii]|uniref:Uncharacterized protein n=1 Tax=Heterodera schachtii TaxID=97005 RepID=A0ABD2HXY8_HETSC